MPDFNRAIAFPRRRIADDDEIEGFFLFRIERAVGCRPIGERAEADGRQNAQNRRHKRGEGRDFNDVFRSFFHNPSLKLNIAEFRAREPGSIKAEPDDQENRSDIEGPARPKGQFVHLVDERSARTAFLDEVDDKDGDSADKGGDGAHIADLAHQIGLIELVEPPHFEEDNPSVIQSRGDEDQTADEQDEDRPDMTENLPAQRIFFDMGDLMEFAEGRLKDDREDDDKAIIEAP